LSSNRSNAAAPLPPDFAAALERARHRFGRLGTSIAYLPTTSSTNDFAAALAPTAGEGAVVIADTQTAGRGRLGRAWFSPPGSGLYVSVVVTPGRSPYGVRATRLVTLAAGVALAQGVAAASGLAVDVKWPNDLYIGRRKLAGILAESSASGAADAIVLGFGINVSLAAYPPELADRATSLESELGRPVDRSLLLAESIASLAARYDDLLAGRFDAILDAWRSRAPGANGARVTWAGPSGSMTGVTSGVDEDGALLVRVGDRIERIIAGQVTWG
jgi:BirA family biotin operon repressor/biotin-[acetyl-CoA-carboxylase] ligase